MIHVKSLRYVNEGEQISTVNSDILQTNLQRVRKLNNLMVLSTT